MGKFNLTALNVRQSALAQKQCGKFSRTPCWADVIAEVPPSSTLVRNRPVQHPVTQQRVKTVTDASGQSRNQVVFEQLPNRKRPSKKGSRMFKPLEISYEEDQLRKEFFQDHPWELARPRVVVESDGRDYTRHDWSKLQQKDKKLDGESVVQHQLHLLQTVPDMTKGRAYDIARKQFYKHRLQEQIEQRIVQEEARATGAYFDRTMVQQGIKLEDEEYERWKEWSEKESALVAQRSDSLLGIANDVSSAQQDDSPADADTDAAGTENPQRGPSPEQRSNNSVF